MPPLIRDASFPRQIFSPAIIRWSLAFDAAFDYASDVGWLTTALHFLCRRAFISPRLLPL